MPFLGERHQFWVNYIKRIRLRELDLKDRLIALLFALLLVTVGFFEFSSEWTHSRSLPQGSRLYLTSSSANVPAMTDPSWSNEKPNGEAYWIKSEITLSKDSDFDVLLISFAESYLVYWDGYHIGTHEHQSNESVTQLHLLDKHHVLSGIHHVMLRVPHPTNNLLDLSKKQLLLGKEEQLHMMAIMELFLLIAALGLLGIIILLFINDLRTFHSHPNTSLAALALISTYLGLSLVDTLHHQAFTWSNPTLLAIATACSLQLVFTLSKHRPNLLFKSFFSIAAATYVIMYFVLGNPHERLILYFVALLLTYFFLLYTSTSNRVNLLLSLVPLLPLISPLKGTGFFMIAFPSFGLLASQLFWTKPLHTDPKEAPTRIVKKEINYLLVNSKSDKKSIPLETVDLIKAANNYSIIMVNSGETFLHDKSLLKLTTELPENFKRIHKSYLVNFDRIEQVKNKAGGGKILHMKNGEEVPVGRVYQKELNAKFA